MQEQQRKVWVFKNEDYHLCRVVSVDGFIYTVEMPDGSVESLKEFYRSNPPKYDLVEDLASLSHLNEPSVLNVLKNRYHHNHIYTNSGLFLVAINPYKNLEIYSQQFMQLYAQNDSSLRPHIYKTVCEAYTNMLLNKTNQSILITGESGAGKTENTKKAISFLLNLSESNNKQFSQTNSVLVDQIIKANIILEAFGNAMTIRNDNSSRFGKFIQLNFHSGDIVGCIIEKYLLEKSRVVQNSESERNYHIFYQLLRSNDSDLLSKLHLSSNLSSYKILNNFTDLNDNFMFNILIDAFNTLNFKEEEVFNLFKFIAVILHLGNLEFFEDENVKIRNMDTLTVACNLLGIPIHKFIKYLLNPVKNAGKESMVVIHSINQVKMVLDSVIKSLYDYVFNTVVFLINRSLNGNKKFNNFIGILDIAGFEIFPKNSYEQMCINFTNEKLQQFFNHHMFILEQDIYKRENIDWNYIDFGLDLKPTIDTIEEVFGLIDDQCLMINSSDDSLLLTIQSKFAKNNQRNLFFNKINDNCFKLIHYAGVVEYFVNDWLIKNYDPYFSDIIDLLNLESDNQLTTKGFFRTVSQFYKNQLDLLMKKLINTNPFFVRCIIPNNSKSKNYIDNLLVLKQLKCNGVLEGIRISRLGYPNRMKYDEFVKRYRILITTPQDINSNIYSSSSDFLRATENILGKMNIKPDGYKFGNTMIFFKQDILGVIEESRENIVNKIFTNITNLIKIKATKLKQTKAISRTSAIKIIQTNILLSNEFRRWKWWYLYQKIKPLLKVAQIEEVLLAKDKEIKKLKEELIVERESVSNLNSINNGFSFENNSLSKINETIKQLLQEKENEILNKQNENSQFKNELNILNANINSLNELIVNKNIIINDLNANENILQLQFNKLKDDLLIKEKIIDENTKQLIKLETEIDTKKKVNEIQVEETILLKNKELEALKYEKEILKQENSKLINEINLSNKSLKELNNKINELNKVINENKEIKEELKDSINKINKLNKIIEELEYKSSDYLNIKLENELLNKEIERKLKSIEELEEFKYENERIINENNKLNILIKEKEELIINKENKISNLENKINNLENKNIKELEVQFSELTKKLIKEKKINKQLEKNNLTLFEENKKLNSNKITEIELLKNQYQKQIKALELKIATFNFSLKEESESNDERINFLLEEEKRRNLELEKLLQVQESKNLELLSLQKNKEYDLFDKINHLNNELIKNKERYYTLINQLNSFYKNQPKIDHALCNKKLLLLKRDLSSQIEFLNIKSTNLNSDILLKEEENLDLQTNLFNLNNSLNECKLNLINKEKEFIKLKKELNEIKLDYESICKSKLDGDELQVNNEALKRKVDELERLLEFYKPFAVLKR